MKLVVAIVHVDDSAHIIAALAQKGYGTTCLASQGSFLQQENRTLFTGVADERVKEVISIIRGAVHWRQAQVPGKHPGNSMVVAEDDPVTVAGATVFVLDVDQFMRV